MSSTYIHTKYNVVRTAHEKRSILLKQLNDKEEAMRAQAAAAQDLVVDKRSSEQEVVKLSAKLLEFLPLQVQLSQSRNSERELAARNRHITIQLESANRILEHTQHKVVEADKQLLALRQVEQRRIETQRLAQSLQVELATVRAYAAEQANAAAALQVSEQKRFEMAEVIEKQVDEISKLRDILEKKQSVALAAKQKALQDEANGYTQAQLWEQVQCLRARLHELLHQQETHTHKLSTPSRAALPDHNASLIPRVFLCHSMCAGE